MPFTVFSYITYSKNIGIMTAFFFFFINSQAALNNKATVVKLPKQQNGNTVTQGGLHVLSVLGIRLF